MWFDEETLTDCGRITGNPEAGRFLSFVTISTNLRVSRVWPLWIYRKHPREIAELQESW